MPTSVTPPLPVVTTPVPQRVQRQIPSTGNTEIDAFLVRLQRTVADPVDSILAWVNANFGTPAATRATGNQGTRTSPSTQTTQTAQQQTQLVGPNGAPLVIPSATLSTVNGLTPVTRSKYFVGGCQTKLASFVASASNVNMIPEGYGEPMVVTCPYAGSLAALTAIFTNAVPSAGAMTVNASAVSGTSVTTPNVTPAAGAAVTLTWPPNTYTLAANTSFAFRVSTNAAYASANGGALIVSLFAYDP